MRQVKKTPKKKIRTRTGPKSVEFAMVPKSERGPRHYRPSKFDFAFVVRKGQGRIRKIDPNLIQVPAKQKLTKSVYTYRLRPGKIAAFAAVTILLVLGLQGAVYLSAAKDASGEILGAATSAYSDLSQAQT